MVTRTLNETDVYEITRIHLISFSTFFLTRLGESFLKFFYKSFLKHRDSIGFGIFDNTGLMVGFSVATARSSGFNKSLIIQNLNSFFFIGLKLLVTKPGSLLRLILNLSKKNDPRDDGDYAELYSIAVDPGKQGLGIGKILLAITEKAAFDRGCKKMALTTDFYNNSDVVSFYKSLGYVVFYEFIAFPDRKMYKLVKTLI